MAAGSVRDPHLGLTPLGPMGVLARVAVGSAMVASVAEGHISGPFHPGPWVLGLVGFPLAVLAVHRWLSRQAPARLCATGITGQLVGVALFLAMYFTWWYAPALDVTSDAVLLFYGTSMLVAAARHDPSCEVLATSNWLLRRDDQIGCLLFAPLDSVERRASRRRRRGVDPRSEEVAR